MKKYEFLEHTADAKFRAHGKKLEDAFGNAALAMYSIMLDPVNVKSKLKREIKIDGTDQKSLLYNFLEEFLFMVDVEGFMLNKLSKLSIKKKGRNYHLDAVAHGDNAENYKTTGDIKAVTYNEMEIKKEKDSCMVQVVVDI
ncbi:MAG: archease [bacterium]|nr:archease [bacterium]